MNRALAIGLQPPRTQARQRPALGKTAADMRKRLCRSPWTLDNEVGKSVVFSFPLIGPPLRALNVGLGSSAPVRGLWENLAADESGRRFSISMLCQQWDWASQIYVDLVTRESTEQVIYGSCSSLVRHEAYCYIARKSGQR
jgi:hypothetical protein